MTKRADGKFKRNERDFYPTPMKAVLPLLPWLNEGATFVEPCAGAGDLIKHLEFHGHPCDAAYDIEPQGRDIDQCDALDLTEEWLFDTDYIITNPPWDRKILHPMIDHFRKLRPTWLLLDADWMFTKQARRYLDYCELIVSVGRVKWIPDSPHVGFDNCAWYKFSKNPVAKTWFVNEDLEKIK